MNDINFTLKVIPCALLYIPIVGACVNTPFWTVMADRISAYGDNIIRRHMLVACAVESEIESTPTAKER